jgi:hypothetical protein
MSYTYLQEQGEESSAESFADIPAYVLSSGINMPASACSQGKEMDHCHDSPYGMTLQHSMQLPTGARCKSCVVDFHARIYLRPEKVSGLQVHEVASGNIWRELLMRYDHASSSLKTHLCLWEEDLQLSSVTLPQWGLMQDGVFLEQMISGVITCARGAGYWPTPLKDTNPGGNHMKLPDAVAVKEGFRPKYYKLDGMEGRQVFTGKVNPEWAEWLMGWPMGWTNASTGLEMDKFRLWQQQHSAFCHKV